MLMDEQRNKKRTQLYTNNNNGKSLKSDKTRITIKSFSSGAIRGWSASQDGMGFSVLTFGRTLTGDQKGGTGEGGGGGGEETKEKMGTAEFAYFASDFAHTV